MIGLFGDDTPPPAPPGSGAAGSIRGVSLWQPWATLMDLGAKRRETRSWSTTFRGWLLIHAAKRWTREQQQISAESPFRGAIAGGKLPLGCLLCVVRVVDCQAIRANLPSDRGELAFGDYQPGRFQWITDRVVRIPTPIPFLASQGFFDVPRGIIPAPVLEQLT